MDRQYRVGWLVAICLFVIGGGAEASPYTFSIIAQPGDVIEGHTIVHFSGEDNPIAINNNRDVVFMAAVDSPRNYAIMTPDRFIAGAGKVVDGVVPTFADEDHLLSINDAGQVAYRGLLDTAPGGNPSGRGAIFINEEIIATHGTVIDGRTITGVDFRPAINNAGTVAYVGWYEGHEGKAIFTQDELVVERGQVIDGLALGSLFRVQIHDDGTIAYSSGIVGQSVAIFTQDRLVVQSGYAVPDGPFIINDVIDGRIIGGDIHSFGISDDGEIAFFGVTATEDGTPLELGLFTQNRVLVESGDIIDGKMVGAFRNGRQFNDSGSFSILALLENINGADIGLFVDDQFVLGTGDAIEGKVVDRIHHIVGMNDHRDLAFLAHFDDGSSAIVMAAVPEGSTAFILAVSMIVILTGAGRLQPRESKCAILRAINSRPGATQLLPLVLLAASAESASAQGYQLEIIAQEGDVIDGREILAFMDDPLPVAINNDREVAFFAGVSWEGNADWAIMTERRFIAGAGKEVDGRVPNFNSDDHWLDINNAGQVVYTAPSPGFGRGLYVNETLVLEPGDVVDGRTLTLIGEQPDINDSGTIVFESWYQGHTGPAIFTQDSLLVEQGQSLDGYTLGSMAFPQINNHGDVAVTANLLELDTFFKRGVISPERVILKPGDEIEGMVVDEVRVISGVSDSGDVVVSAIGKAIDGTLTSTIMTQDRVLFVPSGDLFDLAASRVVFNDRQQLALLGAVALEEGGFKRVLYVDGEVILSEGDILDGKLITRIYQNFDMNDRGDIAFRVEFEGEERPRAIVLATVPEPAGLALLTIACLIAIGLLRRRVTYHICNSLRI